MAAASAQAVEALSAFLPNQPQAFSLARFPKKDSSCPALDSTGTPGRLAVYVGPDGRLSVLLVPQETDVRKTRSGPGSGPGRRALRSLEGSALWLLWLELSRSRFFTATPVRVQTFVPFRLETCSAWRRVAVPRSEQGGRVGGGTVF